jgi:hypothetical protein
MVADRNPIYNLPDLLERKVRNLHLFYKGKRGFLLILMALILTLIIIVILAFIYPSMAVDYMYVPTQYFRTPMGP